MSPPAVRKPPRVMRGDTFKTKYLENGWPCMVAVVQGDASRVLYSVNLPDRIHRPCKVDGTFFSIGAEKWLLGMSGFLGDFLSLVSYK